MQQPYGNGPQNQYPQQQWGQPQYPQQGYYPPQQQGYYPPQQEQEYAPVRKSNALGRGLGGAAAGGLIAAGVSTFLTGGLALPLILGTAAAVGVLRGVRPGPEGKQTITGRHKRGIFDSVLGNGFRGFLLGGAIAAALVLVTGGFALPALAAAAPLILGTGAAVGAAGSAIGAVRWTAETGRNVVTGIFGIGKKSPQRGYGQQQGFEGRLQSVERGIGSVESIVAAVGGIMGLKSLISKFTGGKKGSGPDAPAAGIPAAPDLQVNQILQGARQEDGKYVISAEALAQDGVFKALQERGEALRHRKSGFLNVETSQQSFEPVGRKDNGVVEFTDAQLMNGGNLEHLRAIAQQARGVAQQFAGEEKNFAKQMEGLHRDLQKAVARGDQFGGEQLQARIELTQAEHATMAERRQAALNEIVLPKSFGAQVEEAVKTATEAAAPAQAPAQEPEYKGRHAASAPVDAPSQQASAARHAAPQMGADAIKAAINAAAPAANSTTVAAAKTSNAPAASPVSKPAPAKGAAAGI